MYHLHLNMDTSIKKTIAILVYLEMTLNQIPTSITQWFGQMCNVHLIKLDMHVLTLGFVLSSFETMF